MWIPSSSLRQEEMFNAPVAKNVKVTVTGPAEGCWCSLLLPLPPLTWVRADHHELSQESRALVPWRPPWIHSPGSSAGFPPPPSSLHTGRDGSAREEYICTGGCRYLHMSKCPYLRPLTSDSPGTKQVLHCTKLLHPRSELLLLSKASSFKSHVALLKPAGFIHTAQVKGLTKPVSLHYICFAYTHSWSFSLLRRKFPKSQRKYVLCKYMYVTLALYPPSVFPAMLLPCKSSKPTNIWALTLWRRKAAPSQSHSLVAHSMPSKGRN